jgi:Spy/CpxP family protein refolding chaperone
MRTTHLITLATLAGAGSLHAQEHAAPYAGLETRTLKALSEQEVQSYLQGDGMGFALAAELNHYPGPKHVLELAEQLALSPEQRANIERQFTAMQGQAAALGRAIVDREQELDSLFASGTIDSSGLEQAVSDIARLTGELRFVHLRAHLAVKDLLTEHQIGLYDQLRGYGHGHSGHLDREP